jgi:hypothetical protein
VALSRFLFLGTAVSLIEHSFATGFALRFAEPSGRMIFFFTLSGLGPLGNFRFFRGGSEAVVDDSNARSGAVG